MYRVLHPLEIHKGDNDNYPIIIDLTQETMNIMTRSKGCLPGHAAWQTGKAVCAERAGRCPAVDRGL